MTQAQLQALREREAQQYFGMSADAFIAAYRAGAFDDDIDRPRMQELRMLFPV